MRTRLLLILPLVLILAACADPAAVGGTGPDPSDTPIPVEPDGGIGDGATPLDDAGSQGVAVGEPDPGTDPDGSTPIPVEPDGGIGDGAGAPGPPAEVPDFGVSSETDSASVTPYTSCWSAASGTGTCADGTPDGQPTLAADAQLVVTFAEGELSAASSGALPDGATQRDRRPLPVVQENPGIWLVDVSGLEPGEHTIWLDWLGAQGDAFAAVTVVTS